MPNIRNAIDLQRVAAMSRATRRRTKPTMTMMRMPRLATVISEDSRDDADFKFSSSEDEIDAARRQFVTEEHQLLARPQQLTDPWNLIPAEDERRARACSQSPALLVPKISRPVDGREAPHPRRQLTPQCPIAGFQMWKLVSSSHT